MDFRDEIDNITFHEKNVSRLYIDEELIWEKKDSSTTPELYLEITPVIRTFDYNNYNHIIDFNISCEAYYHNEDYSEVTDASAHVVCEVTEEEWDIIGHDEFDTSYMFSNENSKEFTFTITSDDVVKFETVIVTIPFLDGTENIISWSTLPNNTSNGVFTSHGSYLQDMGWDGANPWKIEFDYKNSYSFVGPMLCTSDINPFTDEKNRNYGFSAYQDNLPFNGAGVQWIISPSNYSYGSINYREWAHVCIETVRDPTQEHFIENDFIRLTVKQNNSSYVWEGLMFSMRNWETIYLGTRDNPRQRNFGTPIQYKNIVVFESIPDKEIPTLSFIDSTENTLPTNYETGDTISFKVKINADNNIQGNSIDVYNNNDYIGTYTTDINGETNLITLTGLQDGVQNITAELIPSIYFPKVLEEINISIGYILQIIEYPSTIIEGRPSSITVKVLDYLGNSISGQHVSIVEYIEDWGWEQVSQGGTTGENGIVIINPAYISDKPFRATMFRSSVQYNSEIIRDISVLSYNGVNLTVNEPILSYSDNDTCTLSAQLTNNNSPININGIEVEFFKDSISLGTAITNSNGIATKSYTSTGEGDISMSAEADTYTSNIISIEDCIEYQPLTNNAHQNKWTIPSNAIITYDNNGMKVTGSSWADLILSTQISKPCTIEWQMGTYSSYLFNIYLWDTSKTTRYLNVNESNNGTYANKLICDIYSSSSNNVSFKPNAGDIIKIEIGFNACKVYVNDSLKITKTHNHISPFLLGIGTSSGRHSIYKNLKIKPLDSYNGIELTTNKSILSYANNETCTLSAQLINNGNPVNISGVTVEFFNGNTSLGTASTNSNGIATKTYNSQGIGNMTITAQADTYISNNVNIEDCYLYDIGNADKSNKFTTHNTTLIHNTDHYEATTTLENGTVILYPNVDNYIAEFDMQSSTTGMGCGVFNSTDNHYNAYYCKMWGTTTHIYTSNGSGTETSKKSVNHSRQNDWYHMLVKKEGNSVTITVSRNGSQVVTYTQSISTGINLGMIESYNNRTFSFKNIKIKSL